jgi:hypothetical protein
MSRRTVLGFALLLGLARSAAAGPYERLGDVEREAVDAAMARLGLSLDAAPEGKRIGRIHVWNRNVFSEQDGWFLRWFNHFHATTAEDVVARELLVRPGDLWNADLADESRRNLKDPLLSSVVVVLPVASQTPGYVDLLVVTRDVWSLRTNSQFALQNGSLTKLQIALAENNLFGWRKKAALWLVMDQGEVAIGPSYIDPNIRGTRLQLTTDLRLVWARQSGHLEGHATATTFEYPLWSLRTKWGGGVALSESSTVTRFFKGDSIRSFDVPGATPPLSLPEVFRERQFDSSLSAIRSFGMNLVQRLSFGHRIELTRPSFTSEIQSLNPDPAALDAFKSALFPRSELASEVFAHYQLFTPVFAEMRDLQIFDLREDKQIGPTLDLDVAAATQLIGSTHDFVEVKASAGWAFHNRGGLESVSGSWAGRLQDGRFIDNLFDLTLYAASPRAHGLRLHSQIAVDVLVRDQSNQYLTLGSDNGLRGYAVAEFMGKARLSGNVEVRTSPLRFGSMRVGGALFWDFGHAAPSWGELDTMHDVGFGLRTFIPQIDTYVLRWDWAFPIGESHKTWPGHFTVAYFQVFG